MLYGIIDASRETYRNFLKKALLHASDIHAIKNSDAETDPLAPSWNNGFLPGLDIIGIYTLLSEINPGKYVEVGSGHSTKVVNKVKKDNGLDFEITSIDPSPRAEIDPISDHIIRKPFESIDLDFLSDLQENDVLFIDNSHRILPNSDSMVFFLEVLPKLRKGVIVHLHDIYLPYDYPQFMCDRFYSEQYGLAICLLSNRDRYVPLLPNYFISEDDELSGIIESIWNHPNLEGVERHGGSFWFRIND